MAFPLNPSFGVVGSLESSGLGARALLGPEAVANDRIFLSDKLGDERSLVFLIAERLAITPPIIACHTKHTKPV